MIVTDSNQLLITNLYSGLCQVKVCANLGLQPEDDLKPNFFTLLKLSNYTINLYLFSVPAVQYYSNLV